MAYFANAGNRLNPFTDAPNWALPYIEYCYERSLMQGVGGDKFDPQGEVNPSMACTVILRHCGVAATDWDYNTSVAKARGLGIAPVEGTDGDALLRGTMAVIISRGMSYANDSATPNSTPDETFLPLWNETQAPAKTLRQNDTSAMTIDEMKAEIVRLTNEERTKAGLPGLEALPELMDSAQAKADDMLKSHYYGHTSPVYGYFGDKLKEYVPKAKSSAENLAPWTKTPAEAFAGWVESGEHYAHIIGEKYTHIGVGIIEGASGGYWWVQHFAKL
jgi:uncharacterized protein YkwD